MRTRPWADGIACEWAWLVLSRCLNAVGASGTRRAGGVSPLSSRRAGGVSPLSAIRGSGRAGGVSPLSAIRGSGRAGGVSPLSAERGHSKTGAAPRSPRAERPPAIRHDAACGRDQNRNPKEALNPKSQTQNRRIGKLRESAQRRDFGRLSSSARSTASAISNVGFSRGIGHGWLESARSLCFPQRDNRARNPSFRLKNSQDSFGMAAVFELGKEPDAGRNLLVHNYLRWDDELASGGRQPPVFTAGQGADAPRSPGTADHRQGADAPRSPETDDHRQGADAPRSPGVIPRSRPLIADSRRAGGVSPLSQTHPLVPRRRPLIADRGLTPPARQGSSHVGAPCLRRPPLAHRRRATVENIMTEICAWRSG